MYDLPKKGVSWIGNEIVLNSEAPVLEIRDLRNIPSLLLLHTPQVNS